MLATSVAGAEVAAASPAPTFTFYTPPTPDSATQRIVTGSDGNLWFTEQTGNAIGRITPAGVITEFVLPTAEAQPIGITAGPDGNLWFTEAAVAQIGTITPSGVITEYPSGAGTQPEDIVTGPDGNLWVTEPGHGNIDVFSPAGAVLHEYPTAGPVPVRIVVGADNNLWFTELATAGIGRMDISGSLTQISTPDPYYYLAEGADGNVWLSTTSLGHSGGTITPAGVFTTVPSIANEYAITAGPDGDIWADNGRGTAVDEINPAGTVVASYALPAGYTGSYLHDITEGPDGNIWFTTDDGRIGLLDLHPTAVAVPTLPTTGIGPGSWVAGGIAVVAVLLGLVALLIGVRRRPRRLSQHPSSN